MIAADTITVDHAFRPVAFAVFAALFALVTVLGFIAATWRPGDLSRLDEWGLAGRRFGPVVTWFLLGGAIFTAYTYVAVPALVVGEGAAGFFALPYTIMAFPLVLVVIPRLWTVYHRHGYITTGDFVRGRHGTGPLTLAIASTGLLATMPYIALQLVGIQTVLAAMGIDGDWPLVGAFALVAAYTYHSGLRAPALVAIVKDVLIFVTVLVVVVYVPWRLHGFGAIFDAAQDELFGKRTRTGEPAALLPAGAAAQQQYATLAFGSAMALLLYPHVLTCVLSARSRDVIRRNAIALPIYSLVLGCIALFGYLAIAAGIRPQAKNDTVPDLILHFFPDWFSGFALAAIAIGALVPAAVMSIAVANLFTRNIYKEYLRPHATAAEESHMARLSSLWAKAGALAFVVLVPTRYTIDLQLIGGVWILQTLPALVIGLYSRWLHRWGLLAGWAAGMVAGTCLAAASFGTPISRLHVLGIDIVAYKALFALALNLLVAVAVTAVARQGRS